ncbi:hypothetical protein TrLO_g8776 [Triparma laevis f. longispina]|uniref:ethanolamine-phosphate cytidylyltransferase n=1 Tax=Triparma laevis f. longispina TaxID=1714387 RepID=A0A9W7C492_9STRA|nr:hypothetical protein TrLO_g8776 [Triparma laevis f. longispina]
MSSSPRMPSKISRTLSDIDKRLKDITGKLPDTDGWAELFLKPAEKEYFCRWEEVVQNRSLSAKATNDLLDYLASFIPDNISPNFISLSGLCLLAHCWYMVSIYGEENPTVCSYMACGSLVIFYFLNGLDERQSIRIRQKTSLNDYFKYSSDCLSTVFLSILFTYCLGVTEWSTQWYSVQASQLILFTKHLSAFHRNAGLRYNLLTGPGEVITFCIFVLFIRSTLGLDWLINLYGTTIHQVIKVLDVYDVALPADCTDINLMGAELVKTCYYVMYITSLIKCLLLPREHWWSRFGIAASLLMRLGPALFLQFNLPYSHTASIDVISDGFFMSILISDVTLAKMAGRELHPWVILMSFASLLSHTAIFVLCCVYYIAVFGDLCHHLNMPLLTVCRNVYCDGVYDLCHIGHKNLFKRALTYGNRLFVGVCNDEDCSNYKRPPIMTSAERCAEVAACKAVTKVIPNAPCFGITKEFIDKHQIHVVAFGQEYLERWPDPKDDKYYSYPRSIGIARAMPRTPGLSTSDLIRRIQASQPADVKKSPT